MPVLITGGCGFVGLNIAESLMRRGEDVVLFDTLPPPEVAAAHLGSLPGALAAVAGDVRERSAVIAAIREHGVDRLVHGAAITAALPREAREARRIADVNLGGTIETLEAALACGLRRVVQIGTGSALGTVPDTLPAIDETYPARPESLYGITKYAAERTALRYRETRGLDVVVARLGVVFGRWEYDTGVRDTLSLPLQLMTIAEAGGRARFRPDLPNDWVEAVAALLGAPTLPHPVYHLATGRRWSPASWCDRLAAAFPGFSYAITEDRDALNVGVTSAAARPPFAVDRMRDDTGFSARFDEADAFADYLAWYRERRPVAPRHFESPDPGENPSLRHAEESRGAARLEARTERRASFETPAPQAPQDDAGGGSSHSRSGSKDRPA